MALTIIVPTAVMPWQADWLDNRVVNITQITSPEPTATNGVNKTYILPDYDDRHDRVVYIPLTPPEEWKPNQIVTDVGLSTLTRPLAGLGQQNPAFYTDPIPAIFCSGCETNTTTSLPPSTAGVLSFALGVTLFIPFVAAPPSITPDVGTMINDAIGLPKTTIPSPSPSTPVAGVPPSSSETSVSNPDDSASSSDAEASSSSDAASSSASETTSSASETTSSAPAGNTIGEGELAGGVIGGFLGGVAICALLMWFWLPRRRRRQMQALPGSPRRAELGSNHSPRGKEMRDLAIPMSVTGWQKHLPQEKDDGTIARTVKTVFDQVQVHMEGFYKPKSEKLTEEAMAAIKRISPPDLARKLGRAPDSVSLLEAILVRWIVQRMSLRSVAAESFLPVEYTKIPKQNGWHMESDENGNVRAAEIKKGFPQAFSQWRVLTAFLRTETSAMRKSKPLPNIKIDQGVRDLTNAMAPWNVDGNAENREHNLRDVLQLASDAALLIFAQPSTFMFDWSAKPGTVTISPSLVKRLDASGNPLPSPLVLVRARTL